MRRYSMRLALAAAWLLIAAWLYRGLFMDDAYIGFRYVANLLAGQGFVFDPATRVEGVTNTGWLLLLALPSALLGEPAERVGGPSHSTRAVAATD